MDDITAHPRFSSLGSLRSSDFSSETRKPAPLRTGDFNPSVLHRKFEIRRGNRWACQAATEPAWQCTKAITKPSLQTVSASH